MVFPRARIAAETKVKMEAQIAETKAALDEALAKWDTTVEAAKVRHEARVERWFNREEGWFKTLDRLRATTGQTNDTLARKDLEARGFEYPWDETGSDYSVVHAASNHSAAVNALTWHTERMAQAPLGSQAVISWHQSEALAHKALGTAACDSIRARGDTIEVRTDITVRERVPRAKKTA